MAAATPAGTMGEAPKAQEITNKERVKQESGNAGSLVGGVGGGILGGVAAGAAARLAARGREQCKNGAYKVAMKRVKDLQESGVARAQTGWLDDRFVPLGYEVGGAWGPSAANAFEEVLAVKAATTNRELTDFSIIKFAKHWREAVGVAILRGAAAVVAQAEQRKLLNRCLRPGSVGLQCRQSHAERREDSARLC